MQSSETGAILTRPDSTVDVEYSLAITSSFRNLSKFQKRATDAIKDAPRPTRREGMAAITSRLSYAVGLIFSEKELLVFAVAQWLVIAGFYVLWVFGISYMPQEMFEQANEDSTTIGDILFTIWSIFCILVATLPLGILTGCMVAVHFLRRHTGQSSIPQCLGLIWRRPFAIWFYSFADGYITVMRILDRLPKKDDKRTPRQKAFAEFAYYAWKVASAGMMPSLVLGNSLMASFKHSLRLVKQRGPEVMALRIGYSTLCWIVGLGAYAGGVVMVIFNNPVEGELDHVSEFIKALAMAGIPLVIATGIVQVLIRPFYLIALCDVYSDYLQQNELKPRLERKPLGIAEMLLTGLILGALLGGIIVFAEQLGLG
ncbi:MAG: hypothetical protein AAF556_10590, partial [Pseudomonadota bacterium]